MANEVRPGMRFRRRGDGHVFTAMRCAAKQIGAGFWFTDAAEKLGWPLTNSEHFEPIPEPAPELCTVSSCGVGDETCSRPTPGTKEQHDRRRLKFPSTHDFVAPQAKPLIAKPADIHAGPPITGTAKPVLREPMPLANGYPDACLGCRGDKTPCNYVCRPCVAVYPSYGALISAWDALHRKPAAKDIPSPVADTPTLGVEHKAAKSTEAARGGEAAVTHRAGWRAALPERRVATGETGESAVTAAPTIEPWRPSVDDLHWIPDAVEGWRR